MVGLVLPGGGIPLKRSASWGPRVEKPEPGLLWGLDDGRSGEVGACVSGCMTGGIVFLENGFWLLAARAAGAIASAASFA